MRRDLDRIIDQLAAEQWGVWTSDQANRLGMAPSLASSRVLKGRWIRPHPHVYAHAAWVRPPEGELLAAAWSLPDGHAGMGSAAWLHGVPGAARPPEPEIIVVRKHQRARSFPIHTTTELPAWCRTHVRRVPCTTIARTLVDLSVTWPVEQLADAWSTSITDRRVTLPQLEAVAVLLAGQGWRGTTVVEQLLAEHDDGEVPPESVLERQLADLVEAGGYGQLVRQAPLPSFRGLRQRADGLLPEVAILLEADGRRWHTRVQDFERDRRRDNEAQALGYDVARFTHRELAHHRDVCFGVLDAHFRRRGFERSAAGVWLPAA